MLMNIWNVVLGAGLVLFGIWLTVKKIRFFARGERGTLGYDVNGLGFGFVCIVCGFILI
ncbi:hypothetical protein KXD93_15480 [Mucilaginibacter sp. BJC16-A38]|uniref:hypothetical protein n=1 Tax=Mucilaginibacter phenanthrenivorans TaxID=1234842 RepID=UPI0021571502|nr:hypothetical protein [Mucilaginibacter phenanthrenivorans]MCR8559057.1 hypothetical protein [Mucilaginibacter phenanthrenivorans]